MGNRKRRITLVLASVTLVAMTAVIAGATVFRQGWHMASYDYGASNSAPAGFPMQIGSGDFIFPNGGSLYVPPATLRKGWGESESHHVVGADTKPIPQRLEIVFYSYLEDKLYEGGFELPYARIEKLFHDGYMLYEPPEPRQITFHELVVGVAPGGAVAVWASGIARRVEVFFGHADESADDWHRALQIPTRVDRAKRRESTLNRLAERDPRVARNMQAQLPLGAWDTYRKRYAWTPVFEDMGTPKRLERMTYLNGEQETLELPVKDSASPSTRPVPTYLKFLLREPGLDYTSVYEVTFDEDETLAAFQRLAPRGEPLELVFRATGVPREHVVSIRTEHESVSLTKVKRELFGTDRLP